MRVGIDGSKIILTQLKGHDTPWDGQTHGRRDIFRGGKDCESQKLWGSGGAPREKPTAPQPTFLAFLCHCHILSLVRFTVPAMWLFKPSEMSVPSSKP